MHVTCNGKNALQHTCIDKNQATHRIINPRPCVAFRAPKVRKSRVTVGPSPAVRPKTELELYRKTSVLIVHDERTPMAPDLEFLCH